MFFSHEGGYRVRDPGQIKLKGREGLWWMHSWMDGWMDRWDWEREFRVKYTRNGWCANSKYSVQFARALKNKPSSYVR